MATGEETGLDAQRLEERTRSLPLVRRLVVSREVDSTQDQARRMAERGAGEGTVLIAHRQTGGRGSRGRAWHSPAGTGLYFSVILRPGSDPALTACWTLAAALAVCKVCREAGPEAEIKWPNDVLIRNRKVAGILAELRSCAGHRSLILGVGLNVVQEEDDFPPALRGVATSLELEGAAVRSREAVAVDVLARLSGIASLMYHGGWSQIRKDWLALAPSVRGRAVRLPDGREGRTGGIDSRGGLLVELGDGTETVLHSSESLVWLER